MDVNGHASLWDYRRRVFEIYRRVREGGPGEATWEVWRADRDELFAVHPQTPLDDPGTFGGLQYYDFDAAWRTNGRVEETDPQPWGEFLHIGHVEFELDRLPFRLPVYWLNAYGGGIFIPFRDRTSGKGSYGGGRYLIDTAKGADLGGNQTGLVLDFNYAYHPSCVHSDRWSCPLAPADSELEIAVTAGERL